MEFGVLGPIAAWIDGRAIQVGGPRQRCVLGALLVHLGREVTVEQIIAYLWNDDPPRTARSVVQVQVSHLRRALPGCISTTSGGYVLEAASNSVDLHRFRGLKAAAERSEPAVAVGLLESALDCWRGTPFSGVGSDYLEYSVVNPLLEERWSVIMKWAAYGLELGRYGDVISRLTPLVSEGLFRERAHYLLIHALWLDNERARALTLYEEFRARLAEELGVDPGPELVELHSRMLREDPPRGPDLEGPHDSENETTNLYLIRNDLPRDLPDFTGRQESLRQLEEVALSDEERAKVCVITGAGGEGKTTTAVRFGHGAAKRYPDGQLFIDLYGYTSNKEPLDSSAALGVLLRAVGTDPSAIPESIEERSALWRATLMGRKVLLVLDNAESFSQVSPLLLSSPGSITLITTRNELSGLSGAKFLSLGMFDRKSSLELLGRILGDERVSREPEQAREITRICSGLPLALRVVAGRMLSRPKWTFAHVARRLGEQDRKFHELRVEGQSVETAIDLSYQSLNNNQRRSFLLLGLMIGNTIDLAGASALMSMELEDADDILQELVGMCLLEEPQGDVYRLHDLIRAFSQKHAVKELGQEVSSQARTGLAEYYFSTAQHAADLLGPRVHGDDHGDLRTRYRRDLSGREEAEKWFSLHQENLSDAIEYFASHDNGEYAWRMADAVWRFYALHGQMGLLVSSHERALHISDKQGNHRGRAVMLIGLGVAHYISGRFGEALNLLVEARGVLAEIGDSNGMIRALANLGMVYERVGRFADSADAIKRVLEYASELGYSNVEARQWSNLAVLYQTLGKYDEALCCGEMAIHKSPGEESGEDRARVKRVTGEARVGLGNLPLAFQDLREALELSISLRLVGNQIYVHNSLGLAYRSAGCWDEAVESHNEALVLAENSGDRSGDSEILTDLGMTYTAASRYGEAAGVLKRAREIASERGEAYMLARASLALGRLPEPVVEGVYSRELLTEALRTFEELGLPEAGQAREALAAI